MENLSFLFAAYSAVWVALFLYVYGLWRRQNRIKEDLQALRAKISEQEKT